MDGYGCTVHDRGVTEPAAIPLAPNLWRVPTAPFDLVNSFIVRGDDDSLTVVDTGMRTAPPRILAALRELRSDPAEVTTIVLTHAHPDHAGGAARLARETGTGITAHPGDAGYIESGTLPPVDPTFPLGRIVRRVSPAPEAAPIAATMRDGELLKGCDLRVHHTPGHSPGHCSLLHEPSQTLITGDCIWNAYATRTWPVLMLCTNAAQNEKTAATLADLEYRNAAFTHGPEIMGTGRDAVRLFLAHPRRFGAWR